MSDFTSYENGDEREPLDPEDDWFAAVADEPAGPESPVWQDETYVESREPVPPGLGGRQIAVMLAVLGAVVLAGAVIVGVRAIGDSDGGEATPAVTTTQVPDDTTPETTPTNPTETGTGTTTTPETTVDAVPADAVLRPGDSGDSVTTLQQALQTLGYDPGEVDGKYGDATEQAVVAFQQSKSLTADGIAGPKTIAAINEALGAG